jgi:hypothetical protein
MSAKVSVFARQVPFTLVYYQLRMVKNSWGCCSKWYVWVKYVDRWDHGVELHGSCHEVPAGVLRSSLAITGDFRYHTEL